MGIKLKTLLCAGTVLGLSGAVLGGALPAAVDAAPSSALYVDIRDKDTANARIVERWKLYNASKALVIGIDAYNNGWPRLSMAVRDAETIAAALQQRGFEVTLLTNVTGDELRTALRRFFAIEGADPNARLFVWFAGHGHTEGGEGFLVPVDAPAPGTPEFRFSALHMADLAGLQRLAVSKHALTVFDSCFGGTVFTTQRSRPPQAITHAVTKPVRQFLTSGDADQTVSDDGTFRTLFLRAISGEEGADINRDGYVTASELGFHMSDRMINLTRGAQTPRSGKLRDARFDRGDFVFQVKQTPLGAERLAALAPDRSAPSPPDNLSNLRYWRLRPDILRKALRTEWAKTGSFDFWVFSEFKIVSAVADEKDPKLVTLVTEYTLEPHRSRTGIYIPSATVGQTYRRSMVVDNGTEEVVKTGEERPVN